jgi:pimeloyl-ACP methyl ester carboxylesterase/DNA-binding CsgD family transcriptional regulator
MSSPVQQIRFSTSRDGTRIAYEVCGAGLPMIWVQHWIHHLQYDWESPIWRHWLQFLARGRALVRYDWRGCGLSDRNDIELSMDKLVEDLESVVGAAGFERFVLFGMSGGGSGVAVNYAVRHPDRVSQLILHGALTKGRWAGSPTPALVQEGEARLKVYELGWAGESLAYGQFFTALHIPDATVAQKTAHNALLRQITCPASAVRLVGTFYRLDSSELLREVSCPTLVFHARGDSVIPFEEGRKVAALIPGAQLVPLESPNHVLLENERAWPQFMREVEDFLPKSSKGPGLLMINELTAREREVLEVLAQGLDNSALAARLKISEKTARNHLSIIFSKLGVNSRAQAIILARDSGFGRRAMP